MGFVNFLKEMEISDIKGTVKLNNGIEMPYFGLGVFEADDGQEVITAIHEALEAGYRHVDTATLYQNEAGVGEAVRTSGLRREEIFVTTKVWNSDQGYRKALDAFQYSLDLMKLDYIDLYLIHWPVRGLYIETWRALEEIYANGLAKAIGVSNFMEHHLNDLLSHASVVPAVNQIEYHPYIQQPSLIKFCKQKGIQPEAWSPIIKGRVNSIPAILDIAAKHQKNPVQVTLRWELQKGVVVIPKSVRKERILSNADIFDFQLSPEEMKQMDAIDRQRRIGPSPDSF